VVSGAEELVGSIGEVIDDFDSNGRIRVHSESWAAHTAVPVRRGQKVRVIAVDGLMVRIEPV